MYPDNAYFEFYPADIVDRILLERPDASVEQLNQLMQAEWDIDVRNRPRSMAELADILGL